MYIGIFTKSTKKKRENNRVQFGKLSFWACCTSPKSIIITRKDVPFHVLYHTKKYDQNGFRVRKVPRMRKNSCKIKKKQLLIMLHKGQNFDNSKKSSSSCLLSDENNIFLWQRFLIRKFHFALSIFDTKNVFCSPGGTRVTMG